MFVAHGVILWGFCYAGQHELGHWTVFRSRALNDAFGHLASFPRFYAHNYQRFFHFAHHRHTKVAGRDPELLVQKPWTLVGYLGFVAGPALLDRPGPQRRGARLRPRARALPPGEGSGAS